MKLVSPKQVRCRDAKTHSHPEQSQVSQDGPGWRAFFSPNKEIACGIICFLQQIAFPLIRWQLRRICTFRQQAVRQPLLGGSRNSPS